MSAAIRWSGVTRRYDEVDALVDFTLEAEEGEILCLVGPSGCGKTTALRALAGFERVDEGTIEIHGRVVVDDTTFVNPERRSVGMVFQDYALFPHLNVTKNVGYGLSNDPDRVAEILALTGLDEKADRMPHELSGGEQQRVALARALAPRPDVILFDEPFSSLDASLRDRMRRDLRTILKEAGATAVLVTHDQEEALAIADRVAIMRDGTVLQSGDPVDVYERPADSWVAGFLGDSVGMAGEVEGDRVRTPLGLLPYSGSLQGSVEVMIRPEWIHAEPDADGNVVVTGREFYGHDQMLELELSGGANLIARCGPRPRFEVGDKVSISIGEAVVFPAG